MSGLPAGQAIYVTLSSFVAGSWITATASPTYYTYHTSSTVSSLPIMPSPYSETIGPPTPTSFTIAINSSTAGFTGPVTFAVSGLPSGATYSFNPTTVTGNNSTDLTITPSATGPGYVASVESQEYRWSRSQPTPTTRVPLRRSQREHPIGTTPMRPSPRAEM